MKRYFVSSAIVLCLSYSCCVLAGCGKPQPPPAQDTARQRQQAQGADQAIDEAAKIFAEEMKRRASVNLNTQPPPTLGERLGVAGRPFVSYGGGFAITPPPGFSPFEEIIKKITKRQIELHLFNAVGPSKAAIILGYNDVADEVANEPSRQLLERGRDEGLKEVNGTVEKQEFLTVEGQPAISVYLSTGDQLYARQVMIIKRQRLYQMVYIAYDRAELDRPEVQALFNSFKFLE